MGLLLGSGPILGFSEDYALKAFAVLKLGGGVKLHFNQEEMMH